MSQEPMAHKTFQERGYCTRGGYARLDAVLGELCRLGNAALQERRDAWKMCGPGSGPKSFHGADS